jgi:hypothetical protein
LGFESIIPPFSSTSERWTEITPLAISALIARCGSLV